MPRVDSDDVIKLIEVDNLWTGSDVDGFLEVCIASANSLVDALCLESGYGDPLLKLIEQWLAAHFYAIVDQEAGCLTVDQVGSLRGQYSFKVALGLNYTKYGQQALRLDYKGDLAEMDLSQTKNWSVKRTARVHYLGGDP